jgi:3-(methylthio)propanoyl-CoA dehydrogenase
MQVHGGMGYIEETGAAQHLRDARITTIYEGTTGIQANDLIGRKLVRDDGVAMRALIATISDDAASLAAHGDEVLHSIAADLSIGVQRLKEATTWMLATAPREGAASAVPYLKLCGTVMGAWLMARAADAASTQLGRGDADAEFLAAKRLTALHYALHVLPLAGALRDTVLRGADSTLSLSDAQF